MREYRHGMKWAFWRWKLIPCLEGIYLNRLHIFQCPLFTLMLHFIKNPDPDRHLHDHPVSFLSIVLRGGYEEQCFRWVDGRCTLRWIKWFNFKRASFFDKHRIVYVLPNTITLVITGPNRRVWGFHTPKGWIAWNLYEFNRGVEKDIYGSDHRD